MHFFTPFLASVFIGVSIAQNLVAPEKDQDLTYWKYEGWQKLHRVEPYTILQLTFALKQENVDELENVLLKVSDPDSAAYGQYLTVDEITSLVSPSDEAITVVKTWLTNSGVKNCNLTKNQDFLSCHMDCETAEKLISGSRFFYFKHKKLSHPIIRSDSRYYLPSYISQFIDFVGGVHRFPSFKFFMKEQEASFTLEKSNITGVYPNVLRKLYNLRKDDVGSHPNNSQSVAQFIGQYFLQSDVKAFMERFVGSDFVHRNKIDKIVGPNGDDAGMEASLDTQYITSLGANITTWCWSTDAQSQEPFLQWVLDIGNTTEVPYVHSVSYGQSEKDTSSVYMKRVNIEFMKLGVRGLTILFASGDSGDGCDEGKFAPDFPASSPYVTAVGGTRFEENSNENKHEVGNIISGGGFSNVFKQPSYQAEKVAEFLKSAHLPPAKYYNKSGRAYPDIAAMSDDFWIVTNGQSIPGIGGTSAAAPTVAGIVSMLNEHRLYNKKPVMGFLNPFLYKNSQALHDITEGCQIGCPSASFCSTKGFDPVTGNGTPDYLKLLEVAMNISKK